MVVTWHCDIVRQAKFLVVYGRFIDDLLRSADAIMPTSEHQLTFSRFLPHYLDKSRVVPLGIDLAPFSSMSRHAAAAMAFREKHATPIILFVGRLVFYKGLDVMIDAMKQLPGTLVIVGDGPHRASLEERWRASGLGDRVVFAGMIPPKDIAEWMAAADVGVLPSVLPNETFGLSMVEMMACGVPCVCTDLGTGTTFVNRDGETGLVVKPGDADALAAAVRRLIEDPPLRRRMAEAARARAHTMFSVDAMMRGVHDVYDRALARRAGREP
jgi:rhamnosyl/mannosyltransferase